MDDRLARRLYENNIVDRQKSDAARISLLEKLAVQASVIQLTIDQETPAALDNSLHWQNVFLFDEFVSFTATSFADNSRPYVLGELGWTSNIDILITLSGTPAVSAEEHYGLVYVSNDNISDGYIYLHSLLSPIFKLMQFVVLSEAMLDAGDGCIFGLMDLATFEIDGTSKGIYFRREYTETNWHAVTTDGVGTTDTDTGVPFAADTWFLFEIKQTTTGTIQFYINQILVATHTTNIDTSDEISPTFGMKDPGSIAAWGVTLDYFAMQLAPIIQRWD